MLNKVYEGWLKLSSFWAEKEAGASFLTSHFWNRKTTGMVLISCCRTFMPAMFSCCTNFESKLLLHCTCRTKLKPTTPLDTSIFSSFASGVFKSVRPCMLPRGHWASSSPEEKKERNSSDGGDLDARTASAVVHVAARTGCQQSVLSYSFISYHSWSGGVSACYFKPIKWTMISHQKAPAKALFVVLECPCQDEWIVGLATTAGFVSHLCIQHCFYPLWRPRRREGRAEQLTMLRQHSRLGQAGDYINK